MTTNDQLVARWFDRMEGRTTEADLKDTCIRVWPDGLCSYGSHFYLVMPLRDKAGLLTGYILNGDRSTVSTTRHQGVVRSAAQGSNKPHVIIPFSALAEAGIIPESVQIVEVTPDRTEHWVECHTEQPASARWQQREVIDVPAVVDYQALHFGPARKVEWEWQTQQAVWTARYYAELSPKVSHWEPRLMASSNPNEWKEWDIIELPDGSKSYEIARSRHWLGESLITGEVRYSVTNRCRRCKGAGLHEGDTAEVYRLTIGPELERSHPDHWDHRTGMQELTTVPSCDGCGGRGRTTQQKVRRAYFLSGFDSNERRPSYFLCELPPKARPTTVAEAYETLKPTVVKLAEQHGRLVHRQGDIYAVPTGLTKRELTAKGARFAKGEHVLGTNHAATEVARIGRLTYVRGTLRHAPEGRRPDHVRVTVGKEWHLLAKNTVPVAKGRAA